MFNIRDFAHKLNPSHKGGNYFQCPVCGGNSLHINPTTGAYSCFSGGCACPDIRSAIAPLEPKSTPKASTKSTPKTSTKASTKTTPKSTTEISIEDRDICNRRILDQLTLSDLDKDHLLNSRGLNNEQIEKWKFRSVTSNQQITGMFPENLPGYRWDKKQLAISGKGILCPIYQIDQIVAFKARLTDKKGDQRYTCVSDKNYTQYHIQGEQPLAVLINDNCEYSKGIFVTEGNELKPAIIHLKYNIPVLGGARYWHSSPNHSNKFVPLLNQKTNIINLCLDAGDIKNAGIPFKWYKEFKFFESQGFDVRFVWWGQATKEDNDIDELSDLNNIEFINLDKFNEILKEHNPEAYQKIIDESTLLNNVVSLDGYRKKPLVTFNQKAFNDLYEDQGYIVVDGQFYKWRDSYYQKIDNGLELQRCRDYCNNYAVKKEDKEGKTNLSYPYTSTKYVNDLFKWSQIGLTISSEKFHQTTGINCKNGVLRIIWERAKPIANLEPHDPEKHYFINEPTITYNPNADTKYCDQLLRCLDEKQLQILIRNLGAALDIPTVRKYKGRLVKILFCIGQGSNGKDSIREVISLIFGREQVTNFSLNDFTDYDIGNKNSLAGLSKARINWASESGKTTRIDNSLSLKRFATGDSLIERYLFKDGVEYVPNAIALFNLNELPNLFGTGQAALDRFAPLMFRKSFVKAEDYDPNNPNHELADPRFKYDREFLINEVCPAFLNYMIQGLKDLMIGGIDYTCTESTLDQIQSENNHLFDFIHEMGWYEDPNAVPLRIGHLYEYLETWYLGEGILKLGGFDQRVWADPVKPSDKYVKGSNQLFSRLKEIFPNIRKVEFAPEGMTKKVSHIEGLSIKPKNPQSYTPVSPPIYPSYTPLYTPVENAENLDTVTVSAESYTPYTPVSFKKDEKTNSNTGYLQKTLQNTPNNLSGVSDDHINKEKMEKTGVYGVCENPETPTTQGLQPEKLGYKLGYVTPDLGYKLGYTTPDEEEILEKLGEFNVGDRIKLDSSKFPDIALDKPIYGVVEGVELGFEADDKWLQLAVMFEYKNKHGQQYLYKELGRGDYLAGNFVKV